MRSSKMGVNYGTRSPSSNVSSVIQNGLIASLDASNINSYSGTGTTITDMSTSGAHGTINGTVSYVANGVSSYWNFATANNSNYISSTLSQTYLDFTIVFQPDFAWNPGIVGLIGTSAPSTSYDDSLRFTGSPWTLTGRNPGDTNDWAYGTATTYYLNGTPTSTGVLSSGWNILGGYRTNQSGFTAGNSFPYFLGSSAYPGRSFQGKIAACFFYNRQLSAREQNYNFEVLRGRFGI